MAEVLVESMAYLALVRHGESKWNAKDLWTGLADISLSKKGVRQSEEIGEKLKKIRFDYTYASVLKRAKETLDIIKKVFGNKLKTIENEALNERDYGEFTGKNKWEIKKKVGDEQFQKIRRGWDTPIQNGETLKDVYNRVVSYYATEILPKLKNGQNVLVVAHGNSLRALVKYLENLSGEGISKIEFDIGEIYIYTVDNKGIISLKRIIKLDERRKRNNKFQQVF